MAVLNGAAAITSIATVAADSKVRIFAASSLSANATVKCTGYKCIGTITDAKTSMIYFESKLLFFNGTDFKEYNGTTFQDVVPYVPTIFIATPPAGGGTAKQSINLLTGRKKQEFQGDGASTVFQLAELNIDADIVACTVNGVVKTETTDFTVNRVTGKVTFTVFPPTGSLVIPEWTKVDPTHANLVKKNRFCMTFGPGNDTAIFLWGNPDQKNRRSWCGTLNANYWPVTNFTNTGTNEFAITDIKTNNANYQIIFKENMTHFSYSEFIATTGTYDYPVKDLRDDVGNITFNGVQIVNNSPISIYGKSWWEWSNTTIQDERNADIISQRLENSLSAIDLAKAITFDYQSKKEYWCNVGSMVYIWNYGNNTMYTFDNVSGTCFIDIDGVVYFGSQGTIERVEGYNDNGVVITAQLDTGFNSFGAIHMVKTSDTVYIGLLPDAYTSITVYFKTNKINIFKKLHKKASYWLLDFNHINFNHFTFKTNRNPQTFSLRLNSREYTTIQFRFENAELSESCTLLDFLIQAEEQGEVR